jgi:hypothetical protein
MDQHPSGRDGQTEVSMDSVAVFVTVAIVVVLAVFVELVAAVLPMIIVLALVPPEERHGLAELIAATDSSRKLRVWPALRLAVAARRLDLARNERRRNDRWDSADVNRRNDQAGSQR